jgi:mRNA interferase RelE/StbE
MYEISYASPATRYFKKLKDKQLREAYKNAIDSIREDPFIGSQKSGDLRGIYCYDVKHGGVSYELAYRIYEEENRLVVVILAGTRENFYEELKRIVK